MSITFQDLAVAMIKCEQTQGQSVYQHGVSVNKHLEELIYNLESDLLLEGWRIPDWLNQYKNELLSNLHDKDTISKYTIFHDCGKSWCLTLDDQGNRHFPNHAEVSKKMFLEAGGCEIAANLIGWDMILHICNAEEIANYCKIWSTKDACTLLLTALAEIHSNAKMFGGMKTIEENLESNSFKIKWKQIDRRGKQICKHYFGVK